MAANDDEEFTGVIAGVLAAMALAVVGVVYATGSGKAVLSSAGQAVEQVDIAPIGEPLARVYFGIASATIDEADNVVVVKTVEVLTANPKAIVLLSGFHDPSGDLASNIKLASLRALAVRDALIAHGATAYRVKIRKPESTVGSGSAEEGRRVEIRVQ